MSPTCDLCGGAMGSDAQQTPDAMICEDCMKKQTACIVRSRPLPEPGSRDLTDITSYEEADEL